MRSRAVARAMLHRGAALCAALAVLCALLPPLPAAGEVLYDTEGGEPLAALLAEGDEAWAASAVPADAAALKVNGKSAVLMDQGSGSVLFEQNAREHLPIASVTKVMTLLLVMEAIADGQLSWEENVTCSATAAGMGGSQIWLEPGEIMTVEELVKAAAVVSANDACAALAEHLCGTIEAFVARMNARAAELGMNDTYFVDCSGLDDSGYSCALDVAVMSRALMTHDEIRRFTTIWMDTLRGGKSQLVNTNKLVRHYAGTTGLKTGTTQAAGHCLAATAEKDGTAFVAVMLGCATTADRFAGARAMLDYAFASYVSVAPPPEALSPEPVRVRLGQQERAAVQIDAPGRLLLKKGEQKDVAYTAQLPDTVDAPVEEGQVLGTWQIAVGGEVRGEYPIRAAAAVPARTFGWAYRTLIAALIG